MEEEGRGGEEVGGGEKEEKGRGGGEKRREEEREEEEGGEEEGRRGERRREERRRGGGERRGEKGEGKGRQGKAGPEGSQHTSLSLPLCLHHPACWPRFSSNNSLNQQLPIPLRHQRFLGLDLPIRSLFSQQVHVVTCEQ